MTRVVVIGANGQLGSELVKILETKKWSVIPLIHKQIEVKSPWSVNLALKQAKPEIVINTAAFHQVEECDKNPQEAFGINALGVMNLAEWCSKNRAVLVHLSTDYVFGGGSQQRKPYQETDQVRPMNVYGVSKVAGEMLTKTLMKRYFIIRTSGLFGVAGSSVKGSNFIDRIIDRAKKKATIRMVDDQVCVPTYTKNLAENLERLIKTNKFGTYHMVSQGSCSWYELAKTVLRLTGIKTKLVPIKTNQSGSLVKRPAYSVLKNAALKKLKLDIMRPWQENLKLYLKEKGHLK